MAQTAARFVHDLEERVEDANVGYVGIGKPRRPPGEIYAIALAMIAFLVVPWWVFLNGSGEGPGMFGVATVFSVIAFGLASILVVMALRGRRRSGLSKARPPPSMAALDKPIPVSEYGALPLRQALVQILVVPVGVGLAFVAMAVVDVVVL